MHATIHKLLSKGYKELQHLENGENEARWLLEYVLGKKIIFANHIIETKKHILLHEQYDTLLKMRAKHFPLAYLLGTQCFYGQEFLVTPAVLIPRVDTEILVAHVLELMKKTINKKVLDLGCGSGNISLIIGLHEPQAQILAIDCSITALQVAALNKNKLKIPNVSFLLSHYYQALTNEKFDFIVANPPYIDKKSTKIEKGVEFEPTNALFPNTHATQDLNIIITNASKHLNANGFLLVEHGYNQHQFTINLFKKHGFINVYGLKDRSKNWRVCVGQIS